MGDDADTSERFVGRRKRAIVAIGVVCAVVAVVAVAADLPRLAWASGTVGMVLLVGAQLLRGDRLQLPDGWP